jgi:hypothetical protein
MACSFWLVSFHNDGEAVAITATFTFKEELPKSRKLNPNHMESV